MKKQLGLRDSERKLNEELDNAKIKWEEESKIPQTRSF